MNILSSIIALSTLALMSFSLLKTIEFSGCRHQMISKGFWEATSIIVSNSSTKTRMSLVCNSKLYVEKENQEIIASHVNGSYSFQLSSDINSNELK